MKKFYTWSIHDDYARYWTKESIESAEEFDELYDKAEEYLDKQFDPNDLEVWNPPVLKEEIDKDYGIRKKGDMHATWTSTHGYLFSQHMVDCLGDILRKHGELFQLEVEDREDKLYRYWVTEEIPFEYVNKAKSKFFDNDYADDDVFKIEKLILKEGYKIDALVFRVAEEYQKTIFVSSEFIELIKENDLKGFNFIPDTSYEYISNGGKTILIG